MYPQPLITLRGWQQELFDVVYMIIGNKSTRNKAIPFESLPFLRGNPHGTAAPNDVELGLLHPTVSQIVPIRMTTPAAGQLTEVYFSIILHAATAAGFSVRIMIGSFSNDDLAATSSYTEAEIATGHLILTGTSDPYVVAAGESLFIDDLNLLPGIPVAGDSDFKEDGFVLVLAFDAAPDNSDGWSVDSFRVTCSAQMGLI